MPNFIQPELRDKALALLQIWRADKWVSEVIVTGDCMAPTLVKGSTVLVDHEIADIHAGDIIVFINHDHLTVHRVVESLCDDGKRFFITKGDNNNYCDPPIGGELVLGKVIRIIQGPPNRLSEEVV